MSLDSFWAEIDQQIGALRSARTVDDVREILGGDFFAGSGGDDQLPEVLIYAAGWRQVWWRAVYYCCLEAPEPAADGERFLTYIEGDICRGKQRPMPAGEGDEDDG